MKKKEYQAFLERYDKFEKNNLPTPFWDEERQTLEYVYFNNSDGLKLKGIDYDNKLHINYNLTDALGDLSSTGFYYAYNSKLFQSKKINDEEIENTTIIGHTHAHSFEEVVHALYSFPESFSISRDDEQFYSMQELEYLRRVKKYLLFIGLKDSTSYKQKVGRYRNNKQKKYEGAFIYKYSNKEINSFIKGKNYLIYEYLDFYKENKVYNKGEYQALIVDEDDNFRIFIEFTHENIQNYYSVRKVYRNDKLKDNDKVLVRYFKILEKYE